MNFNEVLKFSFIIYVVLINISNNLVSAKCDSNRKKDCSKYTKIIPHEQYKGDTDLCICYAHHWYYYIPAELIFVNESGKISITIDDVNNFIKIIDSNKTSLTIFVNYYEFSEYFDYYNKNVRESITESYIERDDVNYVMYGNSQSSYTEYKKYGNCLGKFLSRLIKTTNNIKPEDIHIIGQRYNAQIAGWAGLEFTRLTGKKIGRITGLDAREYTDCEWYKRIPNSFNTSIAEFVDNNVISHSIYALLGHATFFIVEYPLDDNERMYAGFFYADTVKRKNNKRYFGYKLYGDDDSCDGPCWNNNETAEMGYAVDWNTRGKYYISSGRCDCMRNCTKDDLEHENPSISSTNTISISETTPDY